MSLPIEVPWILISTTQHLCLMCETLAGEHNVLTRKVELNAARDGYVIARYECPECHWQPTTLTACIDDSVAKPQRAATSLTLPTSQEVKEFSKAPPKLTSKLITLPTEKPLELGELKEHIEKNFEIIIDLGAETGDKSGRAMKREVISEDRKNDAEGQEATGWVSVVYEYGKSVDGTYNPYRVVRNYPCTGALPNWDDEKYEFLKLLRTQLKVANASGVISRPAKPPSSFRGACGTCGDTSGQCGHDGLLRGAPSTGVPMARGMGIQNDGLVMTNREGQAIPDMRTASVLAETA